MTMAFGGLAVLAVPAGVAAQTKMVGGAPMVASRTIVENASASPDLTTLVAAVKAAGLVDTLSSPGPFTVFAPTNEAFNALPAGTVDTLLQPANKDQLTAILTYHVVPGKLDAKALIKQIKAGGGTATLTTVQGEPIKATLSGKSVVLSDAKGGQAAVTITDVPQKNGVVHVIDHVLQP
ncbi:fasciclin domain-containing protein [Sphingomonas sp.]|uniref:fasciclin domain-containing protein n=2 Tax=Sphingomonas TaxID=13687 RepID=UPI003863DDD2